MTTTSTPDFSAAITPILDVDDNRVFMDEYDYAYAGWEEEEEEGGELTLTLTRAGTGREEVIEFMDPAHLLHILTREHSYDEYIPDWFASADRDMIRSLLLDELRGAEDNYNWALADSSGPVSVRALVDLYHHPI